MHYIKKKLLLLIFFKATLKKFSDNINKLFVIKHLVIISDILDVLISLMLLYLI